MTKSILEYENEHGYLIINTMDLDSKQLGALATLFHYYGIVANPGGLVVSPHTNIYNDVKQMLELEKEKTNHV